MPSLQVLFCPECQTEFVAIAVMWSTLLGLCLLLAPCFHSEPSQWDKDFPVCGGQNQSPINIVTHKAKHDPRLTPIIFEGYTQTLNITVQNLGNTAVFALPPSLLIRGGDLPATYKAIQLHLHWGVDDGPGSEHTVDGEQYPMELHIVHIKEQYTTLKEAMNDIEGVAGLAFFYQVSTEENQKFNQVIQALGRIPYDGNTSIVPEFRMTDILPSLEKLSSYYRYSGSLTTPGCNEAILWTIFQESFTISQQQLVNVTKQMWFKKGKPMIDNFRPVQKLNGRIVYKSMACSCTSSEPVILCLFLLCIFGLIEGIFT
ncbi:carbonic anhydrase IV c isoform X2 [Ictalurus punctatus]|uniref:Carbonic anhydrase n=1 Tax=Ictalurus punctatus TaxID=7998 RepID=A0A9F7RK07_ICTPU|nr:carbonic anhydrase IV c isoform X2 [Ictalurus punctatus]